MQTALLMLAAQCRHQPVVPRFDWIPIRVYEMNSSKRSPDGTRTLEQVLRSSHFLLLPSRAEAFGLAAAEANAFAVPALTSKTGGLQEIVRDGVNGRTFSVDAPAKDYADYVAALWSDWPAYAALARSPHLEFERRLNWGVAGAQMRALLETPA